MIHCPVEEHVPIPTGVPTLEEIPTMRKRAEAACRAAAMLCVEGYNAPPPAENDIRVGVEETVKAAARGALPPKQFDELLSTPVGAIRVKMVLQEYDMAVVEDGKRLRQYITNKLIMESDSHDPKVRLKALELLGKITDVALFTERSEVTLNNRSTSELETLLKEKLRRFMPNAPQPVEEAVIVPHVPVKLATNLADMLA